MKAEEFLKSHPTIKLYLDETSIEHICSLMEDYAEATKQPTIEGVEELIKPFIKNHKNTNSIFNIKDYVEKKDVIKILEHFQPKEHDES